jgi:hypothetical protein
MMKEGIQDFIKTVGEEGCYALCLCKAAEIEGGRPPDWYSEAAVPLIERGVERGCIAPDMTVLDGADFLYTMTVKKWTKEYKPAGYKPQKGDYLNAEWFNNRTGKTHFTL